MADLTEPGIVWTLEQRGLEKARQSVADLLEWLPTYAQKWTDEGSYGYARSAAEVARLWLAVYREIVVIELESHPISVLTAQEDE